MTQKPVGTARSAVNAFLKSQFDKKTEAQQKKLAKAIQDGEHEKASELQEKIKVIKEQYQLEVWMHRATDWMAEQIGFGTHISKGIHSSSKGDCVNFNPGTYLPAGVMGHQSLSHHELDASGNAAALPLFSFFDFYVSKEKNLKIKDLLVKRDKEIMLCLSEDKALSEKYFLIFKSLLEPKKDKPLTSEYNKQILWPHHTEDYINIIPLYPSSLASHVHKKINYLKHSEDFTEAKKARTQRKQVGSGYPTINDLGVVIIGGSNPQGVSQLMSRQGGRNYLLPSLPPKINRPITYKLSRLSSSIFDSKALEFHARKAIQAIFDVVESEKNSVDIRNARKVAIDEVLHILFSMAESMRNNLPAGWSKDYKKMNIEEKLWLDPMRVNLEGEEEFKSKRESENWIKAIIRYFSDWLNGLLKKEFKDIKHEFARPEHNEWEREIEAMKKQYERIGRGVFL